jgi:SAM-dependent methyltransferase
VPLPRTARILTAENLAADFGAQSLRAQQAMQSIRQDTQNATEAYYSLILECLTARVTGPKLIQSRSRAVAEPLFRRLCEYGLPQEPADLIKDLYLDLFPPSVRHRLGEYYTPDWLAEKLLAETLREDLGDASKRVLDPACGSGTFLVLLIKHIRRRAFAANVAPAQSLKRILRNVVGFDVNPLAVQAARANYLLALGELLQSSREPLEVPVYEIDSVLGETDLPKFDYIVGNPPWVNWEDLPERYRRETLPLWERYGLFPKRQTAMQTILGAAKYDLSMLMTYVAADRYLCPHGRLGFLISQAIFKTSAAGQGFRRFRLPDGTPLGVCRVEDLVKLKPFDSAANRTAILVIEKGRETQYPVEYRHHVPGRTHRWSAQPVSADPTSPWIAARPAALAALTRILGASDYRAREGANTGGANAVFWVKAEARSSNRLTFRNVTEGARTPVPRRRVTIETDLVYPLLRGRNVSRWRALTEQSIVITHRPGMKLRAIPEIEMKSAFPKAFSYLKGFESLLRQRPAYKRYFQATAPFYSLFNIGEYTFAPWKVVWREQAIPFRAAVVGPAGGRVAVPDHKLMMVAVESEDEAHYLCGALNSLLVRAAVAAYTIETQISTHVLQHIRVARFSPKEPVHRHLASGSRKAHRAAWDQDWHQIHQAEAAVDRWAARLWGVGEEELAELREFLRELDLPSKTAPR